MYALLQRLVYVAVFSLVSSYSALPTQILPLSLLEATLFKVISLPRFFNSMDRFWREGLFVFILLTWSVSLFDFFSVIVYYKALNIVPCAIE